MKKLLFILLTTLFILSGCADSVDKNTVSDQPKIDEYAYIHIDNDKFILDYNKIEYVKDFQGNPAALIYFTFTNKTDQPLSMLSVFLPSVYQDGVECDSFAVLDEYPNEFDNRDRELKDGANIQLCISFKLLNDISELELKIHDNYEKFTTIATQKIKSQE